MNKKISCLCVILIAIAVLVACKIITPPPPPYDENAEKEALTALKVLNESQYKFYTFSDHRGHFATSISDLGYAPDNGSINPKNVWEARVDSNTPVPIAEVYLLKVLPLSKEEANIGYAAIALPKKPKYPLLIMAVDSPIKNLMESLLGDVYRISEDSDIKRIKELAESPTLKDSDIQNIKNGKNTKIINFNEDGE